MESNKPIVLPVEQTNNRQTWMIFGAFSLVICCIVLLAGALIVPLGPFVSRYVNAFSPSTPTAPLNDLEGQIAFVSVRDGNPEIYVSNVDGSNCQRLTNNSAGDYAPAWSPDGTRIAFYSERDGNAEIYVMNADGSNETRLTMNPANDYAPAWSPDGTKIVFHTHRYQGAARIYVMNADGTNATRLTSPDWDDWSPVWSPDGTKILFNSSRYNNRNIWVMNADGSGMKILTHDAADDWWPDWSPDGANIVFHSDRDGGFNLYTIKNDGSEATRLTFSEGLSYDPAWSPDGKRIAFTSNRTGNNDIWAVNPDGSGAIQLTNHPAHDWAPAWRPSGTSSLVQAIPTFTALPSPIDLPKSGNLALDMVTFTSNSERARPSSRAVDGSTTTDWGSGDFPPQWIDIDLGAPATIKALRLLVTQHPSGNTIHRILVRPGLGEFTEIHRFELFTSTGQWLTYRLPEPMADVQVIRIETVKSPSWVGWIEIEVIGER